MLLASEFTDSELHNIREMLTQRYKKDVEIELADCEFVLDKNSDQTTSCPTVFWYARGANFVVFKVGLFQYRTQFFYTPHDQYGTDIEQYTDLEECVATVLRTQSDHERERKAENSGNTSDQSVVGFKSSVIKK